MHKQRDSKLILTQARARFAEKLHGVDTPAPSRWRVVVPTFGVLARAGRAKDAKVIASEYLKRFKNGPDAAAARTVLAN